MGHLLWALLLFLFLGALRHVLFVVLVFNDSLGAHRRVRVGETPLVECRQMMLGKIDSIVTNYYTEGFRQQLTNL